jgi:lysophospholipase L1-like esterase
MARRQQDERSRHLFQGFERPPLWASIVMVVGVVALAVGLVISAGRGSPGALPRADLGRAAATTSAAEAPDEVARVAALRVAFLGDSYSAGTGADPGQGYVDLVLADRGWSADRVFAQGGTGYTNLGQISERETRYLGRVPDVVASAPDVVVVQGSTNDADAADTEKAAAAVYQQLRAGLPTAAIVAVGPTATPADATTTAVRDAVASAARANGVFFADAWDWLDVDDPSLWADDGVHPSGAGHRVLADRVSDALDSSGALDTH